MNVCWPSYLALLAAVGCLRLLVAAGGARLQVRRLAGLHRDQAGAVQSLAFVLTLPVFIMIVLFIVQLSQLTIGRIVVEYAAYAAARSAVVWIPANLGAGAEQENRISRRVSVGAVAGDDGYQYAEYEIEPAGVKYRKIHFAAAMACLPICPSRNVGTPRDHPGNAAAPALTRLYHAYAPGAVANARIPRRLGNKLAYALHNTRVTIRIRHKDEEPELAEHGVPPYVEEFTANEIGWQDQILVTVQHDFALLPGAGRLLARPAVYAGGADRVAARVGFNGGAYFYTLSATVRMNNEGEKPLLPYIQRRYGGAPPPTDTDTGSGSQCYESPL